MIKVLEIIAGSWPIAVIIISSIAGSIVIYIIRWHKQSDLEDKALRASQAIVVRNREDS